MIISKVIRDNRRHITRADYNDIKPLLNSDNIILPRIGSLQSNEKVLDKLAGIIMELAEIHHEALDKAQHEVNALIR